MKASERFTNYIIEHKEKFGDAINIFFKNMKQRLHMNIYKNI
jgi:hypothetical protein